MTSCEIQSNPMNKSACYIYIYIHSIYTVYCVYINIQYMAGFDIELQHCNHNHSLDHSDDSTTSGAVELRHADFQDVTKDLELNSRL